MDNLLRLYDVWKGRSYVNANFSVSSIFNNGQFYLKYYFLRHRNSPLEEILPTVLNIYSILEEYPKVLLKLCITDFDRLKLPRRPPDIIFEHIF